MYTANTDCVMTQGLGGVPVVIQTVTVGSQEPQPQMVLVPVSIAESFQSQLAQVAPSGDMATGHHPQLVEKPPSNQEPIIHV